MTRAYNVVDADGHILEPLDRSRDNYIDPAFRERRPPVHHRRKRQGTPRRRGKLLGNPRRIGGLGSCSACGRRCGQESMSSLGRRREEGRGSITTARASSTWISRRDRRGLPLPEPRPVRRRRRGPRARGRDVPRLQPLAQQITGKLSPTGCSGSRCCRCAVCRARDRRDALCSPSSGCATSSAAEPVRQEDECSDPVYRSFWTMAGNSTSRSEGFREELDQR